MDACFTPVLFQSTDSHAVLSDPVNQDWLALVHAVDGDCFELLARRYYLALNHLRRQPIRPALPGQVELQANNKEAARQQMIGLILHRKPEPQTMFVDCSAVLEDETLPAALKDFSVCPGSLRQILAGPGRPPTDALCLMRAFLAAPALGISDSPGAVHQALHSNPTFARECGFLGPHAPKQDPELTSKQLPALSTCEQFDEVMTRYGLWHHARLDQVRSNLEKGVVDVEDMLAFDTTHVESNSHCDNVVPESAAKAQEGDKDKGSKDKGSKDKGSKDKGSKDKGSKDKGSKHRKIPRLRKHCDCGKNLWETCPHDWSPTDQGAAVVVKGCTRIHWAHKASIVCFGYSEIPIDIRVLNYAATSDGKTLLPHLSLLKRDLAQVIAQTRHALADTAYSENAEELARDFPQIRLHTPIKSRDCPAHIARGFDGIDRFTGTGVPICRAGHAFKLLGRDIGGDKYIWVAPDTLEQVPVCEQCCCRTGCLSQGTRRHIRVPRELFPQINWDHPQHFETEKQTYSRRTGIERAIKRVKVDLKGEELTHRDAIRVQAHFDKRLLALHLLLTC